MTSVWGCSHFCQKCSSIVLPDSFSPLKSESSEQPARPLKSKPPVAIVLTTYVPKYSKNDLQQILKTVLEAWALTFVSVSAPAISELPQNKLKAYFLDIYCGKSYMDYYNIFQQCEDYFAIAKVIEPTRILFAMTFLWDWINCCWQ